jgi:hypothetical protein
MVTDAKLVAMDDDLVAAADDADPAADDLARQVDPGNERADPGDLPGGDGGQRVLVVDARPFDPDLDLAGWKVCRGERLHPALDTLADTLGDERPESIWNGHQPMLNPRTLAGRVEHQSVITRA